jgi:O-antigen/teichoic acid export membrane protein
VSTSGQETPDDIRVATSLPTSSTRAALLWSYALTIGRFATTAVVTLVMASFLDPAEYGVMALAIVWVFLAQSMALHGPAQALIQRDEVSAQHLDAAFWATLTGSAVLAALFAGAAPLWASVNGTTELVHICWALAPTIVLNALVVVPDAILRRHLQFRKLSLRVLMAGLASGVVGIGSAVAGYGVWALVLQQVTLATVSAVAVWVAVPWRPGLSPIRAALRDMRSYSLHSISGVVANFVATRTDALLLGAMFGPVAVGLYRFAVRITDMVSEVAVGGLGQHSLPHLSRFTSNPTAFAERFGRVLHVCALLAFPSFAVLALAAPWLLGTIGPQWLDATPAFRILCVGGALGAVGAIIGVALQAAGRPGIVAAIGWSMAALIVAAMWLVGVGLSSADVRTQVLAIAVTYCSVNTMAALVGTIILFRRVLRVPIAPGVLPALPAVLAAAAAALAGWSIQPLLAGAPPFPGLVATGMVSAGAAGAILIVLDPEVSSYCRRLIRSRATGRFAVVASRWRRDQLSNPARDR